jgi:hypothetical protein
LSWEQWNTYASACKEEEGGYPIQSQNNYPLQRFQEDGTNASGGDEQSCTTAECTVVEQ